MVPLQPLAPPPTSPLVITPRWVVLPLASLLAPDPRRQFPVLTPALCTFHDTRGSQLSRLGFPCRRLVEAEVGEGGGVSPLGQCQSLSGLRGTDTCPIAGATPGNLRRVAPSPALLGHFSVIPDTCPFGKGSRGKQATGHKGCGGKGRSRG